MVAAMDTKRPHGGTATRKIQSHMPDKSRRQCHPPPLLRRVGWLTAFIVVAVLGSFRGFMFFGFENLTWRDRTPYLLIGLAFVLAAISLTRAGARGLRS
jgi:hypothetical protein